MTWKDGILDEVTEEKKIMMTISVFISENSAKNNTKVVSRIFSIIETKRC